MKTIKVKSETNIVNTVVESTGELINQEVQVKHTKIVVEDGESFFWVYASIMGVIDDLDKISIKVLFYALLYCEWNTNRVSLTKPILKEIEARSNNNLKYQTVRNAISKLKELGILIALGSATYRINPRYYWKGGSAERRSIMRHVLEIECPQC